MQTGSLQIQSVNTRLSWRRVSSYLKKTQLHVETQGCVHARTRRTSSASQGMLGAPEARREDWSRLSLTALGRNPACDTSNLGFHPPVLETIHFYCLSQLVCDILPPKSREMCKPLIRVVIRKEITALGRLLYVAIQCTETCTLFSLYFFFLSLIKLWQGWLTVP